MTHFLYSTSKNANIFHVNSEHFDITHVGFIVCRQWNEPLLML